MVHAVILAGGAGERFWPLSRRSRPKQLLPLLGDRSMIEMTIDRISPDIPADRTWVVTGQEIGAAVCERLMQIPKQNILEEPRGNNTCLAIAWAAAELRRRDPDATLVVLSADHAISPVETLRRVLREGVRLAESDDHLITVGITPTRPETAYGYIELGPIFAKTDGITSYQVERFAEKPDRPTAQDYYYDRRHLWNSGMFVWTARALLDALSKHAPGVNTPLMDYIRKSGTGPNNGALQELYDTAECISIDIAVLERADNVVVIQADLAWDDVGSWLALQRLSHKDSHSNVVRGNAVSLETFDTTIYNDSDDLVCAFGVSDLVVVRTGRSVMVAHKSRIDEMKQLMEEIKSDPSWEEYL